MDYSVRDFFVRGLETSLASFSVHLSAKCPLLSPTYFDGDCHTVQLSSISLVEHASQTAVISRRVVHFFAAYRRSASCVSLFHAEFAFRDALPHLPLTGPRP